MILDFEVFFFIFWPKIAYKLNPKLENISIKKIPPIIQTDNYTMNLYDYSDLNNNKSNLDFKAKIKSKKKNIKLYNKIKTNIA
jgi:hypothetical protein